MTKFNKSQLLNLEYNERCSKDMYVDLHDVPPIPTLDCVSWFIGFCNVTNIIDFKITGIMYTDDENKGSAIHLASDDGMSYGWCHEVSLQGLNDKY